MDLGPAASLDAPLVELPSDRWVEPLPDALALPPEAGPEERAAIKQRIRLAYVAALQHLPPRQRAALLLTEVIGWSAVEAAELLDMSVPALNSALQRARATLASREVEDPGPAPVAYGDLVDRFVDAFERYDMDALTAVLREDAAMSMPPLSLWFQSPPSIVAWKLGRGIACKGSRLVPTMANGLPAFGQYKPEPAGGPRRPWALLVVEPGVDGIASLTYFLDTARLFPLFGLPPEIP